MRLLAVRARSRHEVVARLRQRFPPETVDAVEDRLADLGLVDDASFARERVAELLASGKSRRWIARDLRRRRVEARIIEEALGEVEDRADEERALEIARTRVATLRNLDAGKACARLTRYLCQRGYDVDLAFEVSRRVLREAGGPEL
ncbi:MAG: recombination regulator RecX [Actinomycetota bacterium]|nr:recombination regulator RecX [Actinomycetota bacterium]